ncbi:glycosyltransferase [Fangia hongkongensis]|uniref:glycosyltransferase n=2 Tax=Fangia hongkongensis TaxID=270495 RepID=UPI000363271C|nr:glycosyltransferase [Fangia hongkongensis]
MNTIITSTVVLYKHPLEMLENFLSSYSSSVLRAQSEMQVTFHLYIVNNDITQKVDYKANLLDAKYSNISFEFIHSEKNGGYGYGNNLVIPRLKSDYHLVVNPDIIFCEDTFLQAITIMQERKEFGLLTPAVYDQHQKQQFSCKKNPTLFSQFLRFTLKHKKPFFKKYLEKYEYQDHSYEKEIYDIPNCTGCFMFFQTPIFKEVKGFDEQFFYYMDDCDLSRRALEISRILYTPEVKVLHEYQGDAYKNKKLRNEAIKSAFKYWRKWGGIF